MRTRLRALIDDNIADARRRIAELEHFTAELEQVAATLDEHTPDGPCDEACGCTADPSGTAGVSMTVKPRADSEPLTTFTGHSASTERGGRAVR